MLITLIVFLLSLALAIKALEAISEAIKFDDFFLLVVGILSFIIGTAIVIIIGVHFLLTILSLALVEFGICCCP